MTRTWDRAVLTPPRFFLGARALRASIPTHMATKEQRTVEDYIGTFPEDVRQLLETIRRTIRQAAPERATEAVRYDMAAFRLNGKDLVYYAGWKRHVSLYPITESMKATIPELAEHQVSGVTVKFPLDEPLPTALIAEVVRRLVADHGPRAGG